MAIFEGAGVAIITPFHTDGSIDYDKFGEVIEQQIANQTDAIIVCGTTGESATMTHEEHLDVIRYCVSKVAPVKYKGLMMGGWFAATAVGNYLTSVASWLWGLPVWIVWAVLIVLCLMAALFMFAIMKRLEKVC